MEKRPPIWCKKINCTLIETEKINIIIPHYAIGIYYYFYSTIFRESALNCDLENLFINCECNPNNASITVPNYIQSEDEAMLIHCFTYQNQANKKYFSYWCKI